MKKLFSLSVCALLGACIFMTPSCKKIYHATKQTPVNFRLLGFTKVITRSIVAPVTAWPVVTETYSFGYDDNNRLSMELFATNDSNQARTGMLDLRLMFSYTGGQVLRTVTNLKSTRVVEIDTFSLNGYSQITNAAFPFETHTFNYQGKLVANQTDLYRDTATTVSAYSYYTSDNHDMLHQLFSGTLNATFPDSGLRNPVNITALNPKRDSILSYPLNVTWTTFLASGPAIANHTINSNSDQLGGYTGQYLVRLDATDPNGLTIRPVYFPIGVHTNKFFQVYDQLTNRTGDFLQLEAFKTYGVNIYQNEHLIKQISTAYDTTFISYEIDAQSKITQTHVLIRDILHNKTQIDYKLQYDTN